MNTVATAPMPDHPSPFGRAGDAIGSLWAMGNGLAAALGDLPWQMIGNVALALLIPLVGRVFDRWLASRTEGLRRRVSAATLRADLAEAELVLLRPLAAGASAVAIDDPGPIGEGA